MRVVVYGLWHLGSVMAACLARAGHDVVGLDTEPEVIAGLRSGRLPVDEPGLRERVAEGLSGETLSFTTDAGAALAGADVFWVAFDTPVNDRDEGDVAFVRRRLEEVSSRVPSGAIVLVSCQVPVGFTRSLAQDWSGRSLVFAHVPENLRLGRAVEDFERAERWVVGLVRATDQPTVAAVLAPLGTTTLWMSAESAEMAKHALNAFLGTSAVLANELARVGERVGADAKDVEQALRSDPRVGVGAYVAPGGPLAGGTLMRDLRALADLGARSGVATSVVAGVLDSNESHKAWLRQTLASMLAGEPTSIAAVLGLTYKPGTNTLRRSTSLELCAWLNERGAVVRAHDPAVAELPPEARSIVTLCATPREALAGADVAVVGTGWPEYRELEADDFASLMRRPRVVDPSWLLARTVGLDARLTYVAPGRPGRSN